MPKNFNSKQNAGFTLMELIVTICVMGILLAIAIPSFYTVIQNNYAGSVNNDFVISLQYARSEAIKRATSVSVCATSSSAFTACGSSWSLGWIVFVDVSGNGVYNAGVDTIVRTVALNGQNATVTSVPSVNSATYNSAGFSAPSTSNVTFTVSATGCSGTYAHTVAISLTGRINVTAITCP
jgi:type IV fimbrial biogenesis protein FimT